MVSLLSHPFRITAGGVVATVDQGSDGQYNQLLEITVGTRRGERDMALPYGLIDPVWRGLFPEDVQAAVDQFGPPVTIDSIVTTVTGETQRLAAVTWHRNTDTGTTTV